MSNNRFLQSFCALLGAAALVCGTQLVLLATWDWDSVTLDVEPAVPATPTISIELSDWSNPIGPIAEGGVAPAPIVVEPATEPDMTEPLAAEQPGAASEAPQPTKEQAQVALEEPPHITGEARVGDHAALASASANLSVEPATKNKASEPESASEVTQPLPAEISEGAADINADSAIAADAVAPRSDTQTAQPNPQTSSSPQTTQVAQPQQPEPEVDSHVAQAGKPATSHVSAQPEQSELMDDSLQQTGSISIAVAEPEPKQSSPKVPVPQRASKLLKDEKPSKLWGKDKSTLKLTPKLNRLDTKISQVKPRSIIRGQPKRKHSATAAKEKPASKSAAKPSPRETKISQVTPQWKPMSLAPVDKPAMSVTPGKRLDARSYNAKIWSALARKKPKVGQRGSTTVTFAVGQSGALRFVRVSQSSNNPRLDQLALKTVRDAAPLPPPPFLKDGSAAYTIRIDFH